MTSDLQVQTVETNSPFRTRSMHVPIYVNGKTERALIDSGATGCFIDRTYVENNKLQTTSLAKPLRVRNVDNTENVAGMITEKVSVLFSLGERTETQEFYVTELGKQAFILGIAMACKDQSLDRLEDENCAVQRRLHSTRRRFSNAYV